MDDDGISTAKMKTTLGAGQRSIQTATLTLSWMGEGI